MATNDYKCDRAIIRHIALGKEAFKRKKSHMWIPQPSVEKHIVKVFVWSIALYGSETWPFHYQYVVLCVLTPLILNEYCIVLYCIVLYCKKSDIKRLEAFEMWIWRRTLRITWTEHKTNEEVLQTVEARKEILDSLRTRQK